MILNSVTPLIVVLINTLKFKIFKAIDRAGYEHSGDGPKPKKEFRTKKTSMQDYITLYSG
jgi:hypothetical protein